MATPALDHGSTGTAGVAATTATFNAPTGLTKGELLLAVLATASGSSAYVAPVGWTLLGSALTGSAWWKIATDVEPSTYTWTWTTSEVVDGCVLSVSGVSKVPVDAFAIEENSSSTSITAPSVTPRWNADLLVSVYVSLGANVITIPGGQTSFASSVGTSASITVAYETLAGNSATGTRVATTPLASINYGVSFAIREPQTIGTLVPGVAITSAAPLPISGNGNSRQLGFGSMAHPTAPSGVGDTGQFTGRGVFAGNELQSYTGVYYIAGHTLEDATSLPVQRYVLLSPEIAPSLVIRSVFSDPVTGYFAFPNLAPGQYIVQGMDQNKVEDDVVHALVSAVPM